MTLLIASATIAGQAPAAGAPARYASPVGTGTACTATAPCDVREAIEKAPNGISDIYIRGDRGDYQLSSTLGTTDQQQVRIHGVSGRPRLRFTSSQGLYLLGSNSRVENLYIEASGQASGYEGNQSFELINGGVADRVIAVTRHAGYLACFFKNSTVTNSVCWAPGAGATAVDIVENSKSEDDALRNVTAIAGPGGTAVQHTVDGGYSSTLRLTNVIARTGAGGADLSVVGMTGSVATIQTSHSNYGTHTATGSGASLSPSASDQSARPRFVNAAEGNFHQAKDSPTIDHGASDPANGRLDFDGNARRIGAATDIGADEYHPSNSFSFGKLSLHKHARTATLVVKIPGGGALVLVGKRIETVHATAVARGTASLSITPKGKLAKRLKKNGKAHVTVKVTYTPTGGDPRTKDKKIALKAASKGH